MITRQGKLAEHGPAAYEEGAHAATGAAVTPCDLAPLVRRLCFEKK
jgi:hypothetical protein